MCKTRPLNFGTGPKTGLQTMLCQKGFHKGVGRLHVARKAVVLAEVGLDKIPPFVL